MQPINAFLLFAGFILACNFGLDAWVAYLAATNGEDLAPPDDDQCDEEEDEPSWGPIVNSHWGRN